MSDRFDLRFYQVLLAITTENLEFKIGITHLKIVKSSHANSRGDTHYYAYATQVLNFSLRILCNPLRLKSFADLKFQFQGLYFLLL